MTVTALSNRDSFHSKFILGLDPVHQVSNEPMDGWMDELGDLIDERESGSRGSTAFDSSELSTAA